MKKDYIKPTMQVVQLQHHQHILAGSGFGAKGVSTRDSEDIYWQDGGIEGDDF